MVEKISSEIKYDGRIIKVYRDLLCENGRQFHREVVRHSGGACVLAEKDDSFVFVRQYRHPLGELVLEIPAGTREKDENPEVTAVRELAEECGLKAKSIQFVCKFAVSPGYTDEILYIYYANDFDFTSQNLDENENLSVEWVKKQDVFAMLANGEIKDGKTIIALYWYLAEKNR